MKKEIVSFALGIAVSFSALSSNHIDVFGVDQTQGRKLLKEYGKKIEDLQYSFNKEMPQYLTTTKLPESLERKIKQKKLLIQEIVKKYGFLYLDFQTVIYPTDKNSYTTIDVIDKNHPERMRFVNNSKDSYGKNSKNHKKDLIDLMTQFNNLSFSLLLKNETNLSSACPIYHCISDFEHPKLKKYLDLFNQGVIKDKKLVIDTLKHDKDPERRASAALLVGHFQDPKEIISTLMPSVTDNDDSVRNNAMRVIGVTLTKAKIKNLNIAPILSMLDSPYITDRNKALLVLLGVANDESVKKIIIKQSANNLLKILALKQPDNHDSAYLLLKKISNKSYSSTNLLAWQKWANSVS